MSGRGRTAGRVAGIFLVAAVATAASFAGDRIATSILIGGMRSDGLLG